MDFEQIPWDEFKQRFRWNQGEHITMIAPTGQGKTTLARELLPMRRFVAVLATKRKDSSLDEFRRDGYKEDRRLYEWQPRTIIFPPFPRDPDKLLEAHRQVFRRALTDAYSNGGWTIYADEVRYLTKQLKLSQEVELALLQGRSLGSSFVAATQRPRHVPLELYDQATHLFLWRDTDMGNVQRISEIGGSMDRAAIMERIPNLPRYQFLHVNTRDDTVSESKVAL